MMDGRTRWLPMPLLKLLAGTVLVLLYCAVQRGPMVYADTFSYYKVGAEAMRTLGVAPPQARPAKPIMPEGSGSAASPTSPTAAPAIDPRLRYTVAGARSPYYAILLFCLAALGTGWLAAAVQAFVTLVVLLIAFRSFADERDFLPAVAVMVPFTGMAAFATFLMPDFTAATSILCSILLIWRGRFLSRGTMVFLWLLLAFGVVVHVSHMLVAGLLAGACLLLGLVDRGRLGMSRAGTIAILAAVIVAAVAGRVYPVVARQMTGQALYSPPFLTARVYADGPGRAFLNRACAADEQRFAMCAHRHRTVTSANNFLWRPGQIFQGADYETRVRMTREDKAIFLGTLRQDPLGVVLSAIRNTLHILFVVSPAQVVTTQSFLLHDDLAGESGLTTGRPPGCPAAGAAECLPRVTPAMSRLLAGIGAIVGLLAIAWALLRGGVERRTWLPVLGYLLAALALNAAICASLSSPVARYQARVTWLVPAFAAIIVSDALSRRRRTAKLQPPAAGSAR